jgi:hypothetical protein
MQEEQRIEALSGPSEPHPIDTSHAIKWTSRKATTAPQVNLPAQATIGPSRIDVLIEQESSKESASAKAKLKVKPQVMEWSELEDSVKQPPSQWAPRRNANPANFGKLEEAERVQSINTGVPGQSRKNHRRGKKEIVVDAEWEEPGWGASSATMVISGPGGQIVHTEAAAKVMEDTVKPDRLVARPGIEAAVPKKPLSQASTPIASTRSGPKVTSFAELTEQELQGRQEAESRQSPAQLASSKRGKKANKQVFSLQEWVATEKQKNKIQKAGSAPAQGPKPAVSSIDLLMQEEEEAMKKSRPEVSQKHSDFPEKRKEFSGVPRTAVSRPAVSMIDMLMQEEEAAKKSQPEFSPKREAFPEERKGIASVPRPAGTQAGTSSINRLILEEEAAKKIRSEFASKQRTAPERQIDFTPRQYKAKPMISAIEEEAKKSGAGKGGDTRRGQIVRRQAGPLRPVAFDELLREEASKPREDPLVISDFMDSASREEPVERWRQKMGGGEEWLYGPVRKPKDSSPSVYLADMLEGLLPEGDWDEFARSLAASCRDKDEMTRRLATITNQINARDIAECFFKKYGQNKF